MPYPVAASTAASVATDRVVVPEGPIQGRKRAPKIGHPAAAQRAFERLPRDAIRRCETSRPTCLAGRRPRAARQVPAARPRRQTGSDHRPPGHAAVGVACNGQHIGAGGVLPPTSKAESDRSDQKASSGWGHAGLKNQSRTAKNRTPALSGIFADQDVPGVGGDEQPVIAHRMRNQIGQDVSGLLFIAQHLVNRPRPAIVATSIDVANSGRVTLRCAQEKAPATRAVGNLANHDVVRLWHHRPGVAVAPSGRPPSTRCARAEGDEASASCKRAEICASNIVRRECSNQAGRQIVRGCLPQNAAISRTIEHAPRYQRFPASCHWV